MHESSTKKFFVKKFSNADCRLLCLKTRVSSYVLVKIFPSNLQFPLPSKQAYTESRDSRIDDNIFAIPSSTLK